MHNINCSTGHTKNTSVCIWIWTLFICVFTRSWQLHANFGNRSTFGKTFREATCKISADFLLSSLKGTFSKRTAFKIKAKTKKSQLVLRFAFSRIFDEDVKFNSKITWENFTITKRNIWGNLLLLINFSLIIFF